MNLKRACEVNTEQPSSATSSKRLTEIEKQSESVFEPGSDTEYDPNMSANEANMTEDEAQASEKPKRIFKVH